MAQDPRFNLGKLVQPLFVLLLIAAAFAIGAMWTQIQFLEKGVQSTVGQPATVGQGAAQPQPPTTLSSEQFSQAVEGGIVVAGAASAPITLVEFSDFECPFCGRFYSQTLPQVEEEYINTGQVRYVYRHFPITSIHPNAEGAALASECANEQGQFRAFHDMIFENQTSIGTSDLKSYAAQLGLNTTQFNSCLDSKKYQAKVDADTSLGNQLGVTGTPTFYINGQIIPGAQPYEAFQAAFDAALGG